VLKILVQIFLAPARLFGLLLTRHIRAFIKTDKSVFNVYLMKIYSYWILVCLAASNKPFDWTGRHHLSASPFPAP
jgi:hypothetical protein